MSDEKAPDTKADASGDGQDARDPNELTDAELESVSGGAGNFSSTAQKVSPASSRGWGDPHKTVDVASGDWGDPH